MYRLPSERLNSVEDYDHYTKKRARYINLGSGIISKARRRTIPMSRSEVAWASGFGSIVFSPEERIIPSLPIQNLLDTFSNPQLPGPRLPGLRKKCTPTAHPGSIE